MRGTSFLALASLVLLAGCTREKLEHSQVSFSIANSIVKKSADAVNAADVPLLQHMSLNVTGSGMDRVICSIDADKGVLRGAEGPCVVTAASDGFRLSLDVPPGPGRLFQMAMAYKGSNGDSLYYGDITKDIAGIQLAFDIPVNQVGANPGVSGHFSGRWMTAPNTGPSGPVTISVAPEGKPSMILMTTYMYSGWTSGPVLSGTRFEYRVNGDLMFNGPVNLEDMRASVASSGGRVGETSHTESSSGRTEYELFGFYGPGSAGKTYCTSTCAGDQWSDYMKSSSRFYGPFIQTTSGGNTYVRYDAGQIKWEINPTITSGIDGYSIFYSLMPSDVLNGQIQAAVINHGQLRCDDLRKLPGLTEAVVGAAARGVAVPGFSTQSVALVCPRIGQKLMNDVVSNQNIYQDGGGNEGPYLRLNIANAQSDNNGNFSATTGDCLEVRPHLYQGQGVDYVTQQPIELNFAAESFGSFYYSSTCGPSPRTSLTIPSGTSQSSEPIYFKVGAGSGPQSFSTGILPSSATGISWRPDYNKLTIQSPLARFTVADKIILDSCVPVLFRITRPDGSPGHLAAPQDIFIQTTLSVYSAAGCTGGTTDHINVSDFESTKKFYVKATSPGSPTLGLTPASAALFGSSQSVTIQAASGTNTYAHAKIALPPAISINQCAFAVVSLVNDADQLITPTQDVTVNLDSQSGKVLFFSPTMNDCISGTSSSVTFYAGSEGVRLVPFMVTTPATSLPITNFSVAVSDGTTTTASAGISLGVPSNDPVYVYLSSPDVVTLTKTRTWGDHEFPKRVRINITPGYTLSCANGENPSSGAYTPTCGGKISTSNGYPEFIFSRADRDNQNIFTLRVSQNSDGTGPQRTQPVRFNDVYGFVTFVETCTYVVVKDPVLRVLDAARTDVTSVGPFSSASGEVAKLNTALAQAGNSGTVCLGPSMVIQQANPSDTIVMPGSVKLFGSADGTSLLRGANAANAVLLQVSGGLEAKIVNTTLDMTQTGSSSMAIMALSTSGIISQDNRYQMTSSVDSYGIYTQDGKLYTERDRFESVGGIAVKRAPSSSVPPGGIYVQDSDFALNGTSAVAIKLYAVTPGINVPLDIRGNRFTGTGRLFVAEQPAGLIQPEIERNRIDLAATGGLIDMSDHEYNMVLNDNVAVLRAGASLISGQATAGGQYIVTMQRNRVTALAPGSVIAMNGDFSGAGLDLHFNHFGAGGSNAGVAVISSNITTSSNLLLTSEGNSMCSSSGSTNWATFINTTYTSGSPANIPPFASGTLNSAGFCAP